MRSMITCALVLCLTSATLGWAQEATPPAGSQDAKLRDEITALKQSQEDLRLKIKELELQNRELMLTVREVRLEMQQLTQSMKGVVAPPATSISAVPDAKPAPAPEVSDDTKPDPSVEARLELERDRASESEAENVDPVRQEADGLLRQGIEAANTMHDYATAVEILSRAIALDPFENQSFFYRGVAHHRLKHYIEAMADFTTAAQHSEAGPVRTTSLYNIACEHAVLGNKSEAFHYLEKAFSEGFRDFVHVRSDPDLESLQDEARFVDLVKSYEKADESP